MGKRATAAGAAGLYNNVNIKIGAWYSRWPSLDNFNNVRLGTEKGHWTVGNIKLKTYPYYLSTRYLGAGLTQTKAVVITNDDFMQDSLSKAGSGAAKAGYSYLKSDSNKSVQTFSYYGEERDSNPINLRDMDPKTRAGYPEMLPATDTDNRMDKVKRT